MKATNKKAGDDFTDNSDVSEKIDNELQKTEPLLKKEEIVPRFENFATKLDSFKKFSEEMKIENPDTLMVAENTSSEILEIEKAVEKVRKSFKEPYLDAGKAIDEYAKTFSLPLAKAREKINSNITIYKSIQSASVRIEADKREQELKQIQEEKQNEIDKISRIEQQLNARIYGGFWINKNEIRQTSAGCVTIEQCDELFKIINETVPKSDVYKYLGDKHEEMLKNIKKRLTDHRINIEKVDNDPSLRSKIMEKISTSKTNAEVKASENKEHIERQVDKEVKKEECSSKNAGGS